MKNEIFEKEFLDGTSLMSSEQIGDIIDYAQSLMPKFEDSDTAASFVIACANRAFDDMPESKESDITRKMKELIDEIYMEYKDITDEEYCTREWKLNRNLEIMLKYKDFFVSLGKEDYLSFVDSTNKPLKALEIYASCLGHDFKSRPCSRQFWYTIEEASCWAYDEINRMGK